MLKKNKQQSLHKRNSELAQSQRQLEILSNGIFANGALPTFAEKIRAQGELPLQPTLLEILQINMGYMCNQVCEHCHVDAGPDRKEIMTRETLQMCLEVVKGTSAHTLDLTGGAPEMNPHFRWFVEEACKLSVKDLIVRSNLTILRANKKYYDLPQFFKEQQVHVISSMPHWTKGKTDKQRGEGVFDQSIKALQELNNVGYGIDGTNLKLDLVYNPSGAFLPGNQASLEKEFKKALLDDFGIHFNSLLTITNLPISRFLDYLIASENYEDYMYQLVEMYNPSTVEKLMCRNSISVSWDGYLYDCDFNQMLGLKVASKSQHISQYNEQLLKNRNIIISQHCYGCTAGAGSSCQGAVTK